MRPALLAARHAFHAARHAFHPDGFRWFAKLDETIDELGIQRAFFEWVATASDEEIERFIAAMMAYRQAIIDEGKALTAAWQAMGDESAALGVVLHADDARDRNELRRTLKLAANRAELNETAVQLAAADTKLTANATELAATKGELNAIAAAAAE
jgi:hypothetical protein